MNRFSLMTNGQWTPTRTGDYAKDCATGRAAAAELTTLMAESDNPALFGSAMRSMAASGTFDAVEIGFCGAVGIHLIGLTPITAE